MKIVAALLLLLTPAMAQDDKYVGTGMSVTGPASEKKPPQRVSPSSRTDQLKDSSSKSETTSKEETPGRNSATENSH
jgi:hypothetical protein